VKTSGSNQSVCHGKGNLQLQLQLKTLPKCNVSHMQHESELETETD